MVERIQVVGPASSGTRMLSELVRAMGLPVMHMSLPGYFTLPSGDMDFKRPHWWSPSDWPGRYLIIVRQQRPTIQSMIGRGMVKDYDRGRAMWERAMKILAGINGAHWVSYEAIVANPSVQLNNIANLLGGQPYKPKGIYNANAKYV